MSQESADEAPPSSEEADPISLRDVELEPVSLHDIERILAPGRAPPKLASADLASTEVTTRDDADVPPPAHRRAESEPPRAEARKSSAPPPPKAEARKSSPPPPPKAEARKSSPPPPNAGVTPEDAAQDEATTPYVRRERRDDDGVELSPDSAISDLRALVAASKAPPPRESLVNEVLHMGSIMGDAPPPPLVPLDLANFVKEGQAETIKVERKQKPKPPLKQKRTDAPADGDATPSSPADAEPARKSAAPARSVTPSSARPSKPASTSPAATTKAPEKSSSGGGRTALFVAAGVAFLGVGYWLGGRNDKAPTVAPTVTVVVTERVPVETPAPVPTEPAPTENAVAETPEAAPPEPSSTSAAPALTGHLPETAAGTLPAPSASTTAEPAPTATASAEPEPAAAEFDKGAANAALASAVASASACKQEGDPSGQAKVQVTFAPSGRVTVANIVGPPFAGTKTGGCIALAFRKASVPPFSGAPVTVSKTVAIP